MTYQGAKDGKHYWLTPKTIYEKLDNEFHFTYDPCPYPRPDGFDGLKQPWGDSNYVNPPFEGGITAWVRKAISEAQKGKKVVFVFPIDKWIHYMLEAGAEVRNLKDIHWESIEDRKEGPGTGRWIAAFILDGSKLKQKQSELCCNSK